MQGFVEALLLFWFGVGAVATIYSIGQTRKPITPGTAVVVLILAMAQGAGVVYLAHL